MQVEEHQNTINFVNKKLDDYKTTQHQLTDNLNEVRGKYSTTATDLSKKEAESREHELIGKTRAEECEKLGKTLGDANEQITNLDTRVIDLETKLDAKERTCR